MNRYQLQKDRMEMSYHPQGVDCGDPDWREVLAWNVWDTHTDQLVDTIGTVGDWRGGIRGGKNWKLSRERAQSIVDTMNLSTAPNLDAALRLDRLWEQYQEAVQEEREYHEIIELGPERDPYWIDRLLQQRHAAWLKVKEAKAAALGL